MLLTFAQTNLKQYASTYHHLYRIVSISMAIMRIKNILKQIVLAPHSWKSNLLAHWPTIIGNLGTHVTLEKITEDTVTLGVTDSCWLQELYTLSSLICSLINKALDQPRIKHVRFKKISDATPQPAQRITKSVNHSIVVTPLSDHELNTLSKINDLELQEALKNFRLRCMQ